MDLWARGFAGIQRRMLNPGREQMEYGSQQETRSSGSKSGQSELKKMQCPKLPTCMWQECHDSRCLNLPRQMSVHLSL